MIKCPRCNRFSADTARICSNFGYPLKQNQFRKIQIPESNLKAWQSKKSVH